MFTTLLSQLYPPLKGFSQDQAHTYTYGLCSFLQLLQGDIKHFAWYSGYITISFIRKGVVRVNFKIYRKELAFVSDFKIYRKELTKAGDRSTKACF
jgi:hypothetical protein